MTDQHCDATCQWREQQSNVMHQLGELRDGQKSLGEKLEAHALETRRGFDLLNNTISSQVDTSSVRAHARIDEVTERLANARAEASETKGKVLAVSGLLSAAISALAAAAQAIFGGGHHPPTGN